MINRRDFLKCTGGVFAAPLAAAPNRPNVLLILSDQYYHSAMGVAGNPVIKTPAFDRLAREGARFRHAVCPTPFCSPSRATIMTGLYPHRHGITYNVRENAPDERGLDPKLPVTEATLGAAGYTCAQRGKWHLGDKTRQACYANDPETDYAAYLTTLGPSSAGGRNRKRGNFNLTYAPVVRKALDKVESGVVIARTDRPNAHTQETWLTNLAIQQMEKMVAKPFFLTVSLPAPHAPWAINDPYYSMYERARIPLPENRRFVEPVDRRTDAWILGQALGDEGLREYLGVYYGMCSMVDWNVGRLLDALRRLDLERNTLTIFVADHGDMQAGHSMYGKTNFSIYEETTRIPMLMRFPGKIPAGRVVDTQAGLADIRPTILDYLDFPAPAGVHGRSLRSYVDGKEDLTRPVFVERARGRDGFQRAIRTIGWKYVYSSSGESQLYNLEKDPGETRNLISDADSASIRKKLHADLAGWMKQTGDSHSI